MPEGISDNSHTGGTTFINSGTRPREERRAVRKCRALRYYGPGNVGQRKGGKRRINRHKIHWSSPPTRDWLQSSPHCLGQRGRLQRDGKPRRDTHQECVSGRMGGG